MAYGSELGLGDRPNLYDRMYTWKDYAAEAEQVRTHLAALGTPDGARVVEAGCGTGAYLEQLGQWYEMEGFDLDEHMVAAARQKLPELPIWQADMVDFELEQPAEALVCLFSSIGYVYPVERLAEAAAAMHRSLVPGGALIVEPWLRPELTLPGHFSQETYDSEDMKICRATVHEIQDRRSILDMHWLVTTVDGVSHFVDHHELWMYTEDELLAAFRAAGFEVSFTDEGLMPDRGLLLGRRPS